MDARTLPADRVELLKRKTQGNWERANGPDDAECVRFHCPLGEPVNDRHSSHMVIAYVKNNLPTHAEMIYARCTIARTKDGYAVQFEKAPGASMGCQWRGPLLVML